LLASVFDPVTIRHLETIGVLAGWKCIEVGAGEGSIAKWLSKRVGPRGNAVATDIDMRFLSRVNAPNLEVRRHNILKDELEKNLYDLVHCRFLLTHLPEPEKALRRMADSVRPGGWLLIEELDMGFTLSMDVTDRSLTPNVEVLRGLFDTLRKKGIADYFLGRRVRGFVEQLGFVDVGQEGWTQIVRVGDPQVRAWEMENTPERLKAMVAKGMLTTEDVETIQRLFLNASNYPSYTLFSAWGRKPEG
jgi:SAM-dependent methyltransferase